MTKPKSDYLARRQKTEALEVFTRCAIDPQADFHTLASSQVDQLLTEADRMQYRKPKAANGSRGRYFFYMLQRRAMRQV